jgi:hypothetical protein
MRLKVSNSELPKTGRLGVLVVVLATVLAGVPIACGLEGDGSHRSASPNDSATPQMFGRYRSEAVRLGVARPLFLLVDTATGLVLQRDVMGTQKFQPVTDDPAPGADLKSKIPGRYDIKVVPGRRRAGLLRLDTVTGKTWFAQLGSSKRSWQALPSSLDDRPNAPRGPNANSSVSQGLQSSTPAGVAEGSAPPMEAILEVLTQPGYEIELRVWTASEMARLYPAEAAELLGGALISDDPKVMIAIIEGVSLGEDGRARKALESLQGHGNPKVAAAIREKLSVSN